MARAKKTKTPTKYVKATCKVCSKKVDQYLTIVPKQELKITRPGSHTIIAAGESVLICEKDLKLAHV